MAYRAFLVNLTTTNDVVPVYEAVAGDLEVYVHVNNSSDVVYIGDSGGAFARVQATGIESALRLEVRPGDELYATKSSTSSTHIRFLVRSQ